MLSHLAIWLLVLHHWLPSLLRASRENQAARVKARASACVVADFVSAHAHSGVVTPHT